MPEQNSNKLYSGRLAVMIENEAYKDEGLLLAEHLGTVLADENNKADFVLFLVLGEHGLFLRDRDMQMQGDFTHMKNRLSAANLNREMLVRAAKIKNMEASANPPVAVDATAGMGEDSLLLSAAGFSVILYEHDPVIAALLKDTLRRSSDIPELKEIAARMHLFEADSVTALSELSFKPDVILLDPMFPGRQKSGLVKKKFQLIHQLERPCENEEILLEAAIKADPQKIVIKRPLKGPFLAGIRPSYQLEGKKIRYDCIVLRSGERS